MLKYWKKGTMHYLIVYSVYGIVMFLLKSSTYVVSRKCANVFFRFSCTFHAKSLLLHTSHLRFFSVSSPFPLRFFSVSSPLPLHFLSTSKKRRCNREKTEENMRKIGVEYELNRNRTKTETTKDMCFETMS